ncbi:sensor histidine kinase [Cellvibrio sp. KY-GH-1]|uniref:sensor histidine kinase n=1 Tax=Cellvibrio sp. KY-GH-1 TaxID=2303332 RepID=UPI001246D806|nr:histidine kinase [Cellvibrio sp. KY-GH-1]
MHSAISQRENNQRTSKTYLAVQLIFWSCYFLINLIFVSVSGYYTHTSALIFLLLSLLLGCASHVLRKLYHRFAQPQSTLRLGLHLCWLLPTTALVVQTLLHGLIFLSIQLFGPSDNIQPVSVGSFVGYSINTGIMLTLWSILYLFQREFRQRRETEIAHWRDQAKLRDMELQFLRSQINSHFLFNSLNNVRSLILEDPQAARQGLADLATLLRGLLHADNKLTVSLREELDWVGGYLALESLQFEQRLSYAFQIDEALLDEKLPPLLLQTLVENAVKHGIARRRAGGRIQISAQRLSPTHWQLEITNPSAELPAEHSGQSIGLTNTRARLAAAFGDQARLDLVLGVSVSARVDLPLNTANKLATNANPNNKSPAEET